MNKAPIKIGKEDSQIVLYAKGHFQQDGPKSPKSLSNRRPRSIEDMKLLIGYRAGCNGSQISDHDILIVLSGLTEKLELKAGRQFMSKVIFDGEYGPPVRFRDEVEKTPIERYVHAVMDQISSMPVKDGENDLVQLEPLDPTVFLYDMFGYDSDGFDRRGLNKEGLNRLGQDSEDRTWKL